MRTLFLLTLILLPVITFGQEQNVFFLKDNGLLVASKDSADFIRVVSETEKGSDLYNVVDYYLNGKRKALGQSTSPLGAFFQGAKLSFFESGRRKATENYKDGLLSGESDEYFPNGKLYLHKKHIITETSRSGSKWPLKKSEFIITDSYDSTGVQQITAGNGILKVYNNSFTTVAEEGPVKNGKRDGEWAGTDEVNKATFKETYSNGELIAGSATFNGINSTYAKQRSTNPEFRDGEMGLGRFLGRTIRYPQDARESNITGRVILKFVIDRDGTIKDITVVQHVSSSLDAEAIKVIQSSPKWIPGTRYGQPVSQEYQLPINFNIQR